MILTQLPHAETNRHHLPPPHIDINAECNTPDHIPTNFLSSPPPTPTTTTTSHSFSSLSSSFSSLSSFFSCFSSSFSSFFSFSFSLCAYSTISFSPDDGRGEGSGVLEILRNQHPKFLLFLPPLYSRYCQ